MGRTIIAIPNIIFRIYNLEGRMELEGKLKQSLD